MYQTVIRINNWICHWRLEPVLPYLCGFDFYGLVNNVSAIVGHHFVLSLPLYKHTFAFLAFRRHLEPVPLLSPFIHEFLKWPLPFLNLDLSIDANRGFSLNQIHNGKQCRFWCYEPSHLDLHCLHSFWFWSAGLERLKSLWTTFYSVRGWGHRIWSCCTNGLKIYCPERGIEPAIPGSKITIITNHFR